MLWSWFCGYGWSAENNHSLFTNKEGGSKSNKVRVLGRDRVVSKIGRVAYITYEKQQMRLTDARKLEKEKSKKR